MYLLSEPWDFDSARMYLNEKMVKEIRDIENLLDCRGILTNTPGS
jgi:hypothetical protein